MEDYKNWWSEAREETVLINRILTNIYYLTRLDRKSLL